MEEERKSASDEINALIAIGVKSIYDSGVPDVWCGVSHNAWVDRIKDIIPISLIEDDIAWQKAKIASGDWTQYGEGLWVDHKSGVRAGDCTMREIVDGGRSCFEMGRLDKAFADIGDRQMSIGYRYLVDAKGDYSMIYVYERSVLRDTSPVNARTFFSVKRRAILSDAAIKSIADELAAYLEEQ